MPLLKLLAAALLLSLGFSTASAGPTKRIALSFDDSPRFTGPQFTLAERQRRIIDGLRRARVRQAVFFANPGQMSNPDDPKLAWQITNYAAAGHAIANHSFSHPELTAVSAHAYLADIDRAAAWLQGREGFRPWFRFPYLDEGGSDKAKRDAIRMGLATRGLSNGHVTAEAVDWLMANEWIAAAKLGKDVDRAKLRDFYVRHHVDAANFADRLGRATLGRAPTQVLLLHETDLAALFIADLVRALRRDGWTIVTADAAFSDPIASLQPNVPSAQGTLLEALAWQKGLPAPRWYRFTDEDLMRADFRERVLGERAAAF